MSSLIISIGVLIYVILYFTYGKKIERDVVKASDSIEAPSKRLYDGVDYISARRGVLFGHHFASIAGAAPIIGPAVAMCWGWVPGLLWIWLGNAFIGAVHDYLALMASVRYDGKSIQFVATDLMGKRTGTAFYWIVFVLVVFVVAAFSSIVGGMFVRTPAIAAAYLWLIAAALIFGVLVYRVKMNYYLATAIGIGMLVVSIWAGVEVPVRVDFGTWMIVFFFYIIIAAAIPVNVLLQPRDYLNSWLLFAGLLLGLLGALFAFRGFEVPAFSSFSPILVGGKPTPFWPAIPLIIACGSLSGFHSLVASGTTSKQLEKESHGLFIGYGGMFFEGFLSTVVVVSIAGFGYTALRNAGVGADVLNAANWGTMFSKASASVNLDKADLFLQSYAGMVAATWLRFIPTEYVKVIAGMWVAAFVMTSLDTTNRIGRYCVAEMAAPLKESAGGFYNFMTNRWIASVIPAALGIWLGWSGGFLIIWASFGAANQLIASIALMTGAGFVATKLRSTFANAAVIPALLLWITVTAAIIWFIVVVQPGAIAAKPIPGWASMVFLAILLVLNIVFIHDFIKSRVYKIT
jgi:carbon starvation protein